MNSISDSARVLALLSLGQVLGWGLVFYFPVMSASAIAADLEVSATDILSGISTMLLTSAFAAVPAGYVLSRYGTRVGMTIGSMVLGASGLVLAAATNLPGYLFAACVAGVAAPLTLTQAATTVVQSRLRPSARSSIVVISTASALSPAILWPPFFWLEPIIGWRGCCVALSLLVLTIGTASNSCAGSGNSPSFPLPPDAYVGTEVSAGDAGFATIAILTVIFATTGMVTWGLAASLVTALESSGHARAVALTIGAAVGPAQILGRILDALFSNRLSVASVGAISLSLMLIGTFLLATAPHAIPIASIGALTFAVGAGAFTIVRSMLPIVLIQHGFARRLGYLSAVQNLAVAAGPLMVALLIADAGASVARAFFVCAAIMGTTLILYFLTLLRSVAQ